MQTLTTITYIGLAYRMFTIFLILVYIIMFSCLILPIFVSQYDFDYITANKRTIQFPINDEKGVSYTIMMCLEWHIRGTGLPEEEGEPPWLSGVMHVAPIAFVLLLLEVQDSNPPYDISTKVADDLMLLFVFTGSTGVVFDTNYRSVMI